MKDICCKWIAPVTLLMLSASAAHAVNDVGGTLITLTSTATTPNGAWSWFEDERAIIDDSDPDNTLLLVSSVSAGAGAESGDIDLIWYNIDTGARGEFEFNDTLQQDDHNSASLWQRPDGRYVAAYGRHGSDDWMRYRISTNPNDPTSWGSEQLVDASPDSGNNATYNNLHYLPNDNRGSGRLYNFTRSTNFNPNILVSNDLGDTWTDHGRLLTEGNGGDRPYMRYFSDGETVHFFATEGHPRNRNNGIYHGYVQNAQLFLSNGTLIDGNLLDTSAVRPSDLTTVFAPSTIVDGTPMTRAWNIDVAIDSDGNPYGVFQARIDPGALSGGQDSLDHQFFYGRFDGTAQDWVVHPLALAGRDIYNASPNGSEDDYTGLIAVDPDDPNTLYISTPIDPRTDVPMQHYEIFRGQTTDGGATWQWDPITFNSTMDNVRPIMPRWNDSESALLWMRGDYATFTSWTTEVVLVTEFGPLTDLSVADLDGNTTVDLADYAIYLANLHGDFTGITDTEQSRLLGDLNGDFQNNFDDFLIFEAEYNRLNGQGSLGLDLAAVPEPGSVVLLAAGAAVVLCLRRRRLPWMIVSLGCGLLLTPTAVAQITYIDADLSTSPSSNVFLSGGPAIANNATGNWNTRGAGAVLTESTGSSGDTNNFGNEGNTLQALRTTAVDELQIDFTIPTAGVYDVYAFFWDDDVGSSWHVQAGLASGELTYYAKTSPSVFEVNAITQVPGSDLEVLGLNVLGQGTDDYSDWIDGNRMLYGAPLGVVTVEDGGGVSVFIDHDENVPGGGDQRTFFDGVGYGDFVLDVLSLEVETNTGNVRVLNETDGLTFDMRYYEIRSPSGALDSVDWDPLDDDPTTAAIEGWQVAGGSDANILSETNLQSMSTLDPTDTLSLGAAFLTGSDQDLQFFYSAPGGALVQGVVSYVTGPVGLPGDFNGDGAVDAADYAVWRDNLGAADESAFAPGTGNGGGIDSGDYDLWRSNFGSTSASLDTGAGSVPEPTTAMCLAVLLAGCAAVRLRR